MFYLIIITLGIFLLGIFLLVFTSNQNRSFGILTRKKIYQDTEEKPGKTLYATTLPLRGKPDYLIQQGKAIIPVEVKTGKTPNSPYMNHSMQLMAYCLLVEETFHQRPLGGYLRYPEKEFKLLYTEEAEQSVRNLVWEMIKNKKTNQEYFCRHPEHNKC